MAQRVLPERPKSKYLLLGLCSSWGDVEMMVADPVLEDVHGSAALFDKMLYIFSSLYVRLEWTDAIINLFHYSRS